MAALHQAITPELQEFIQRQHVFFVATAPIGAEGHVNVSPKGLDAFRVLAPMRVAYLDITGSGNETAAHVTQNGRITFMFCSFEASPKILRLYGRGRVVLPKSADWNELAARFPKIPGARQIIVAELTRVQTSCGMGVPKMTFGQQRNGLLEWAEQKGEVALKEYRSKNNRASIDGIASPEG